MSKNLVELMAKACYEKNTIGLDLFVTDYEDVAVEMLSVVKEHIGEVAKPCPCLWTFRHEEKFHHVPNLNCKACKGSGIIARTDEGGV